MIDLRSDTASRPTEEMMQSIQSALLGDAIQGEDPTVLELEKIAAEIFGKEEALFTCSGTMSNQIAVMALTHRGDEIIVGDRTHIYNLESGGLAALSQVQVRPVHFENGYLDPETVRKSIQAYGVQTPNTGLICLENTYDLNAGIPVTAENTREICDLAHEHGIPVYLDGARIFNAAVSLGTDVKELVKDVDALQVCLTKGLGAPFGALLVGSSSFIRQCRRLRQRVGGGLRQAGIVAAPAIVGITKMRDRLSEDHKNARLLSEGMRKINPSLLESEFVPSNVVTIDVKNQKISADELNNRLLEKGIKIKRIGDTRFRLMTYHNIGEKEIRTALEALEICLS